MAFASDSTPVPIRPSLGLSTFVLRTSPPVADPRSADELLAEIAAEIDRQGATPELPPEPLLPGGVVPSKDTPMGMLKSEQPAMGLPTFEETSVGVSKFGHTPDAVDGGALAYDARTLHLRRQLAEAAEHGAALLAALGLPRLVTGDFIQVDPVAAGDALDLAIATLDALDGDTDLEEGGDDELSLGWEKPGSQFLLTEGAYSGDRELDTADAEPSLASPERHPRVPTVTWGGVYTARGGDESQLRWAEGAQDDREKVDEDGPVDDDELDGAGDVDPEPSIGWPEDFTAEVVPMLEADPDAEHDDVDLEDGDDDDDRTAEDSGLRVWVFGPHRREVAHV